MIHAHGMLAHITHSPRTRVVWTDSHTFLPTVLPRDRRRQDGHMPRLGHCNAGRTVGGMLALDDFCDAYCREADVFGVLSLSVWTF